MWFFKKNPQVQEQQKAITNDDLTKTKDEQIDAVGKIVDKIANKYLISKSSVVKILQDFFNMSRDVLDKNNTSASNFLLNEIIDDKFIWHNVKDNFHNFFYSSISTDWLLNDLIRDNTTYAVLGENGIGKSYFVLQLALSFILQKSFLSDSYFWRFNRNRRALYVTSNLESPIYVIKERIFEIADFYKIHDDINMFFHNFALVNNIGVLFAYKQIKYFDGCIVPTDNFEKLKRYITDNKIELVIINPAQYFFDFHIGWSENAFAEIYQYFSSVKTTFLLVFNTTHYLNDERSFQNCKHRIDFYRDTESNNVKVHFFNGNNRSKTFLLSKYPFKLIDSDDKKSSNETESLNNSSIDVVEAKNMDDNKPFKSKIRDEIYNNNLSDKNEPEGIGIYEQQLIEGLKLSGIEVDFIPNKTKDAFNKDVNNNTAKNNEVINKDSKTKSTKTKKTTKTTRNKNKEVF